jgi:hypothetical protein
MCLQTSPKNLCQARQINQRQAQNVRRVDFEVYGLPVDALVIACYPRRLVLDFPLDILEFRKPSIWYMVELSPFWLSSNRSMCVSVWGIVIGWDIDELEDKWSSSNDPTSTR